MTNAPDGPRPVDPNQPVTNPALVAAIDRLVEDSSDEAQDAVLVELNRSNFLMPVLTDEMHTEPPDADGETVLKQGSAIKVVHLLDPDENLILPLFTDGNEMVKQFENEPVGAMIMPGPDAWSWALEMGDFHAIVINPAERALPLDLDTIRYLHEYCENGGQPPE